MLHWITIDNTSERFRCAEDVNVLAAMEQAGTTDERKCALCKP